MVHVAQSLVFCVVFCRSLFVFSVVHVAQSLVFCVVFCRSLFVLVGSCYSIVSFMCHGWRLLVGFVWLNLYFSVSWLIDF